MDSAFDWRAALPGIVQVPLASKYWIHQGAGFTHSSAQRYFVGFTEHVLAVHAGDEQGVPDMEDVLARIEELAPGDRGRAMPRRA